MVIEPVKTTHKEKAYVIGMGEILASAHPHAVLTCIGLGSCVAVCAYDNHTKVGGIAHIVLPHSSGTSVKNPAKYADMALPLLISEVEKVGGMRHRLWVKIAGGAQIIAVPGLKDTFNTGEKNVAQIMVEIEKAKIKLAAADVGGSLGRTIKMYLDTGRITIRTVQEPSKEL
jgi:chemotaxis protein CheD